MFRPFYGAYYIKLTDQIKLRNVKASFIEIFYIVYIRDYMGSQSLTCIANIDSYLSECNLLYSLNNILLFERSNGPLGWDSFKRTVDDI